MNCMESQMFCGIANAAKQYSLIINSTVIQSGNAIAAQCGGNTKKT